MQSLGQTFRDIIPSGQDSLPDAAQCAECGFFDIENADVRSILFDRDPENKLELLELAKCKCAQKEKDQVIADGRRFAAATLPHSQMPKTFDNFLPRPGTEEMLATAKEFTDGEGSGYRFLTIQGAFGNGKSHVMEAMARAMLKHGAHVRYTLAKDFLDRLRSTYNRRNDDDFYDVLEEYKNVHALFLDDLGAEADTDWASSQLTGLVEARIQAGARMVISTNLTREQMAGTNPRLASRVFATNPALGYLTKVVTNTSTDYRK